MSVATAWEAYVDQLEAERFGHCWETREEFLLRLALERSSSPWDLRKDK